MDDSTRTTAPADRGAAPPATEPAWHALSADDVVARLGTDVADGLAEDDAAARLRDVGPNRLPEKRERGPLRRFLGQLDNPLILVLIAAGVVTFLLGDYVDSAVIVGVVLINAVIGFIQEGKAEGALAAVRAMLATTATVERGGRRRTLDAADLVPGDVVLLESGDRVPADLRLVSVRDLRIEESALTGESLPVDKTTDAVAADAGIGDRTSSAFSGTLVVAGRGLGVVVGTGPRTEVGRIGALVGEAPALDTPLTRRLGQLATQITGLVLVVAVGAFALAWLGRGMEPGEAFLVVVGMAVAAIPEGLPAVVTIILAIGTRVMAANNAIIRRLPAVEALGSVSVICTDKTGTLTRNEMTAVRVLLPDGEVLVTGTGYGPEGRFTDADGATVEPTALAGLRDVVVGGALCNDARVERDGEEWRTTGDPTEAALVTLALKSGEEPAALARHLPRTDVVPFESEHRFMATLHHDGDGRAWVLCKGAPEAVLALCAADDGAWPQRVHDAAAQGERVLAVARAEVPAGRRSISMDDLPDLEVVGMVGIMDPPRDEAADAVAQCRRAGVRVVMVTGDHGVTAAAIGRRLGLDARDALTGARVEAMDDAELRQAAVDHDVVARASPEHKIRLVGALQSHGAYVAMTGDGVNDAPALKAADVGVAMGGRGTDAARDASDVVLTDDNFATIARAVHQGRVVYDNIKKSLLFILPTSGGQAALILVALVLGIAVPVSVSQVLWINMVTAVTLALALAWEPGEKDVMDQPPRPASERLLTAPLLARVVVVSLLLAAAALAAYEWELGRGSSVELARTTAVNALAFAEILYLFHARRFTGTALARVAVTGNRAVWVVVGIMIVLQLAFTYAPPLQAVFKTVPLGGTSWLVLGGLGMLVFLAVEVEKAFWRGRGVHRM
ncbi:HAD-IC family P-type ATPase [Actinotalea sp. Marseille-Q4924]|uniref:cation-translocating P-type ATPase n=1 Tax=Actinotalea sp. Marseille-Q4924 TaxID=2866571 RepID=UPI001CE43D1D|nr:HAD-IC family P-type ATPase [Actinotalea sp. Marseille-Q4924]